MKPRSRAAQLWLQAFGSPDSVAAFPAQPRTFKQILDGALQLARDAGCLSEAMRFIGEREAEVAAMRKSADAERGGTVRGTVPPSAVCLIAQDPLVLGGYWLPDLLHLAGMTPVGLAAGDEHLQIAESYLALLNPEVIVLLESYPAPSVRAHSARKIFEAGGNVDLLSPGPDLYRAVLGLAEKVRDLGSREDAKPLSNQ
ncbi:hypothetical protein BH23BAC4_BH23BAC4_06590 [soil metagenome]